MIVSAFMLPQFLHFILMIFGVNIQTFLSCCFIKKRSMKICKIENFNRQTPNKITLVFTK